MLFYKLLKYYSVGVVNTIVSVSVMTIGALLGLHYMTYTTLGYTAGLINSFILNFHFTFQVNGHVFRRIFLFFSINISNLCLTEMIQFILIEKMHMLHLPAIIIGMVWYSMIGFILNHKFVFAERHPTK